MSKRRIEEMIPLALTQAKSLANSHAQMESKYFAYIASFGVSVLQSGAYATELFYKDGNRKKVLNAIRKIMDTDSIAGTDKKLILDASTALKLAIRSFEKIDNKDAS